MDESGLRETPLTSADLPAGWVLVPDLQTASPVFIALPNWLFSKMRNSEWVSEADLSRYQSEIGDLIIDKKLKELAE